MAGGIYAESSELTAVNIAVTNNRAEVSNGGGMKIGVNLYREIFVGVFELPLMLFIADCCINIACNHSHNLFYYRYFFTKYQL